MSQHNLPMSALVETAIQRRVELYGHLRDFGVSHADALEAALTDTALGPRSLAEVRSRCEHINRQLEVTA